MTDFVAASCVGLAQIGVGHPFDTSFRENGGGYQSRATIEVGSFL